jgi:hypothetical protein
MADVSAVGARKLKVFIACSPTDEDFAQELLAGLQLAGFDPYLDKHDLAGDEDWRMRLGRLIEEADTVVLVISRDALASERCAWEVERATALKKRLLPIVWRRVEEAHIPPRIKQLNYILGHRGFVWVLFVPGLESDQPLTARGLGPDLPVHNMAAHYPPRAAAVKDGA